MGIYYFAVDRNEKLKIEPPDNFCIKSPGIFSPHNPFPHMVTMMNVYGHNFEITNDMVFEEEGYKDITEEVYSQLKEKWPDYDWSLAKWKDEEQKTGWMKYPENKPTNGAVCLVMHSKGYMYQAMAVYHPNEDLFIHYVPGSSQFLVLDVTHYLIIPPPIKEEKL